MANSIIVHTECDITVYGLPTEHFEVDDEVQPSSRFYWPLIWTGYANDSGIPEVPGVQQLPDAARVLGTPQHGDTLVYDEDLSLWVPSEANPKAGLLLDSVRVDGPFGTVNTSAASATGKIGGLSCTVMGEGKPVDVIFYAPNVYNTVAANVAVGGVITCNDISVLSDPNAQLGGVYSPVTDAGPSMSIRRENQVLDDGVEYTWEVIIWAANGGAFITAAGFAPITLKVLGC